MFAFSTYIDYEKKNTTEIERKNQNPVPPYGKVHHYTLFQSYYCFLQSPVEPTTLREKRRRTKSLFFLRLTFQLLYRIYSEKTRPARGRVDILPSLIRVCVSQRSLYRTAPLNTRCRSSPTPRSPAKVERLNASRKSSATPLIVSVTPLWLLTQQQIFHTDIEKHKRSEIVLQINDRPTNCYRPTYKMVL